MTRFPHRHLLGIEPLDAAQIQTILDTTETLREVLERPIKKVPDAARQDGRQPLLRGQHAHAHLLRDRREAPQRDTLNIAAAASSVTKGETLLDTARNIEAMKPDMIVMRHACAGRAALPGPHCKRAIINAGDGTHEHPTQALLDAFTIREKRGRLKGLQVAIVGDIAAQPRRALEPGLLTKMGAEVVLCGPPTLMPPGLERIGAQVTHAHRRGHRRRRRRS